jgi:hypothetical protein
MERNYKKYRAFVIENFKKFLNNEINLDTLHSNLHTIQDEFGFDTQLGLKCVWFKFSKDDTLATTINQIYSDLFHGTKNNKDFMIEQMRFAINNPKEFGIFYS